MHMYKRIKRAPLQEKWNKLVLPIINLEPPQKWQVSPYTPFHSQCLSYAPCNNQTSYMNARVLVLQNRNKIN